MGSKRPSCSSKVLTARSSEEAVRSSKKTPVAPGSVCPSAPLLKRGTTVSRAPPSARAMTGLPEAMASRGVMPKSSTPGKTKALHLLYSEATASSGNLPRNSTFGPARALRRLSSWPAPTITSLLPSLLKASMARSMPL